MSPKSLQGRRAAIRALGALAGAAWIPYARALGITYTTPLEAAFNALLGTQAIATAIGKIGTVAPLVFEEEKRLAAQPKAAQSQARRDTFLQGLRSAGLENARLEESGWVVAERFGLLHRPRLVLSAALDVADDGRGLLTLLSVLRTMQALQVQSAGDLVFVGTTGRAPKALPDALRQADAWISIDSASPIRANTAVPAYGEEGTLADAARRAVQLMGAPAVSKAGDAVSRVVAATGMPVLAMSDGGPSGGPASAGSDYRPAGEWKGAQALLLATLALTGVGGVCDALLESRAAPVK